MVQSLRIYPSIIALALLMAGGCSHSELEVYEVASSSSLSTGSTKTNSNQGGVVALEWSAPEEWTPRGSSALLRGHYESNSAKGVQSETTISFTPCTAGDRAIIVNENRESIGLPTLPFDQLDIYGKRSQRHGLEALRYHIENSENAASKKIELYMLVAGTHTWIFRLEAQSQAAKVEMERFESLITSISPVVQRGRSNIIPKGGTPYISFAIPEDWVELKPTPPRITTLSIKKPGLPAADFAILLFNEGKETHLANLNKWRRHLDLSDWKEHQAQIQKTIIQTQSGAYDLYHFGGQEPSSEGIRGESVIIAFLLRGKKTWVFRFQGDALLIDTHKNQFIELLNSISFEEDMQSK